MNAEGLLAQGKNLQRGDDGLWVPRIGSREPLSYPDDGLDACFSLENDSFWFRHRNDCIAHWVRTRRPAGPLLDVGGGNGVVADALRAAGVETIVVEPDQTGARNALRRGLAPVVNTTFEEAGFPANSVPAVGMFDVLEHIERDRETLRYVYQRLIPDGFLFVAVPAFAWLWSDHDVEAGHFRRYTLAQLRRRVGDAGFVVEQASYFFSFLVPGVGVLRALPSRLPVRVRSSESTRESSAKSHRTVSRLQNRVVEALCDCERRLVESGTHIPFGSSCFVTARKPQ